MEVLALTIAPRISTACDAVMNNVNPAVAYWPQRNIIHRLLQRCSKDFKMFPELSDAGHLHWHGYVIVSDAHKWFMQVCPTLVKQLGFIKVKRVKSLQGWLTYCTKNLDTVQGVLKELLAEGESIYIDSASPFKRKRKQLPLPNNRVEFKTLLDYGFTIHDRFDNVLE